MRKRISVVVIICFIFSLVSSEILTSQVIQTQQKKIAVLNLVALDEIEQEESNLFTRRLIRELNDDPFFESLPQNEITNLLAGSNINQSSCTSLECGLEAGQKLKVPFVVVGNLSKIGGLFTINVRLIDIENQNIVNSIHDEFRGNELDFFDFLSSIALQITNIPETVEEPLPVNDPNLKKVLDQEPQNVEETKKPQTENVHQQNRQVHSPNQIVQKKSNSKLKIFSLLVLAGAGAAIYFLKSQDDNKKEHTLDGDPTIVTPLPTPPTFPKR